jgi:hypothetical protein
MKNLLLALVTVVVTLCVLDAAFRLFYTPKLRNPRMGVYNNHKTPWGVNKTEIRGNYFRYKPNIVFKHCYDGEDNGKLEPDKCITFKTNTFGYRDIEHQLVKPDTVYRILIFGDSFTVGEGTCFEEIYTSVLQKNSKYYRIGNKSIEIINLGFPGNNTSSELDCYNFFARQLNADMIIVQWNTNDFPILPSTKKSLDVMGSDYLSLYKSSGKYSWSSLLHYLWYHFRTKQIANEIIKLTQSELARGCGSFHQIEEFRNRASSSNAAFCLLIFPEIINFSNYPYDNIIDSLVSFCADRNIECVNLFPQLAKFSAQKLWAHETDHHPNYLAHHIAATELMSYFNQKFHWNN